MGYLRVFDGRIDVDQPSSLGIESRSLRLSMVRVGSLVNYRWPVHRALAAGLGLELGFLLGTAGGGDMPFGPEMGPDFFLDIPLGSGAMRPYLTLSLGFRAGAMERRVDLPYHSFASEWWYYFMPVLRIGLGVGR